MRFRVIALGPREFYDWLNAQMAPARRVAAAAASAAAPPKAQFAAYRDVPQERGGLHGQVRRVPARRLAGAAAARHGRGPRPDREGPRALRRPRPASSCHTIRGLDGAVGVQGPELTHVGARTTIAGGLLENNRDELHRWIHAPNEVKPGNKMWVNGYLANNIKLTPDDEDALVAFLESLK